MMGRASRRKQESRRLFRTRQADHGELFRQAMADVESERRAARAKMDWAIGRPPPAVEKLRQAVAENLLDPSQRYVVETPDGPVISAGADLLEFARLVIALADAQEAGDIAGHRLAALALAAWLG